MENILALTVIIALLFSSFGVYLCLRFAQRLNLVDVPNGRSSHSKPTPRGGGLGLILGVLASAALFLVLGKELPGWSFWVGLMIVAGIGLWDDARGGLRISVRLLAQLVAASLIVVFSGRFTHLPLPAPVDLPLGALSYPISVLWIVAVLNFYNFMDGIDGLAGSQALVTGMALAFMANGETAWLGAAIVGSSLGFLFFNWHPAKIFLGDVGSYSLGFMLASAPFLQGTGEAHKFTMLVGMSLCIFNPYDTHPKMARQF